MEPQDYILPAVAHSASGMLAVQVLRLRAIQPVRKPYCNRKISYCNMKIFYNDHGTNRKKTHRGSYGRPVLQDHEPQAPGGTHKQVTNHRSREVNDHNHPYGTLSCGEPAGGTHAQDVGALYNNVVQGKTDHATSTRRALKQRRRW